MFVIRNEFTLTRVLLNCRDTETYQGMMNKVFISLINLGDLMMGVYLIAIAMVDVYQGQQYCKNMFKWLTSTSCATLGVLNTMASQLSLFSMTALSVFRISTIGSLVQQDLCSIKPKLKILALTTSIVAFSVLLEPIIPVMAFLEDFFVNGLYYEDNPLFTASVSKQIHTEVFSKHYGRSRRNSYFSWAMIRTLVKKMFTDDYGGKISYINLYVCNDILTVLSPYK